MQHVANAANFHHDLHTLEYSWSDEIKLKFSTAMSGLEVEEEAYHEVLKNCVVENI